jgi:hypothetical protein
MLLTKAPIRAATKRGHNKPEADALLEPGLAAKLAGLAAIGLVVMVTGQLVHQPKTFVASPIVTSIKTNVVAKPVREFEVYGGRFRFKLEEVPLLGRADAPNIMVSLFDYSCHQCRDMHHPILEAFQRFSNDLAIVNLPMPLDGKCNPVMKRTPPAHTNACELARLGLTVWRADRKRAAAFDDWMFASPQPRLPADAERYARQLVGNEAFDKAAADPWVAAQLSQDISLFETAAREFHKGYMPQVIIGTNLFSGTFSQAQLYRVLSNQFGLTIAK